MFGRHVYFLNIYPQSQLIIFISLLYSVCSLHVSAPKGHPQAQHDIIYVFMKTIIPQHICYNYPPIMVYVSYYLFIYLQSCNDNSLN
jgi:hypothetical protein